MGVGLGFLLTKMNEISASDHTSVVSINLFVALLCACIVIGHLLEETRWMNESITALIIVSCIRPHSNGRACRCMHLCTFLKW